LGRLDYQVKIRGFRVELGEIEEMLNQHPAIQTSVVVTRDDRSGDKRLVAYIVSRNGAVSSSELREHLLAKLPDYMVPANFVTLDVLPLTPSGKVDRKALPKPDFEMGVKERKFVAPRTPTEMILADIWSEMLGLEQVSVEKNFFALGGHSILAVRVIGRINQVLSFNFSIPLFFRNPTIEKLAKILNGGNHFTPDFQLVATSESSGSFHTFQGQGSRPPLFFLHGDWTGGGFYCGRLSQLLGEDQPFYSLAPHHHSGKEAILTIEDMAADHISLIQKRTPHGPYVLGGFCVGAVVATEIARQLTAKGEAVAQLLLVEPSFISGPLLREFWHVFDVIGALLKWNLKRKIHYFDRCGVPLDRWLKKSIHDKIRAVFNRLGLRSQIESDLFNEERVQDEGAIEILESLDYAKYLLAFRLYHFEPLLCPATLYLPEERPASRAFWINHAHEIFPESSLETIPGNHLTCIVEHASELADRMKKKLASISDCPR
jgi:pimeloyl-ACP methyl ester carboxylesterase